MATMTIMRAAERTVLTALWLRIDGLDAALIASSRVPNLNSLRQRGAWSFRATDEEPVATLLAPWPGDPVQLLFRAVRRAGGRTAFITGRRALRQWIAPEHLDLFAYTGPAPWTAAQETASLLRNDRPHLCAVHLAAPETAACRYGWGSGPHHQAIEACDIALGLVLHTVQSVARAGDTLLVVTSRGGLPGEPAAAPQGLPWICAGPGVPPGRELDHPITPTATAAFLARALSPFVMDAWLVAEPEFLPAEEVLRGATRSTSWRSPAVAPGPQQLQLALRL